MDLVLPEGGLVLADQPELRPVAVALLNQYVPSDYEDKEFQEVINGDYGGGGTTCGFLVHWLMWRLGCRVKGLVNRTDAECGLNYVIGKNISRVRWNPFFEIYSGGLPQPGDIVFISNGPSNTEHVFCFLEENDGVWTSADAGQPHPETGKQCARIRERTLKRGSLVSTFSTRKIQGWISLDKLPLIAPATLCAPS